MKKPNIVLSVMLIFTGILFTNEVRSQTFCNPLNISYRFSPQKPPYRTTADPTIVSYKDDYYLFATQSGGYWHSKDLLNWMFITTKDLPFEKDAPTAAVINGSLYYLPSGSKIIYKSDDPLSGKWEVYNDSFPLPVGDPDLFQDIDGISGSALQKINCIVIIRYMATLI